GVGSGLGRLPHLRRRITVIIEQTPSKSVSRVGKIFVAMTLLLLPVAPVRSAAKTQAPGGAASSTTAPAATAPVDDSTRKAVEALLEMAQDPNDNVRGAGASAILRFGPRAVPVLID